MELDKTVELGMLLDIYGETLTVKKREMLDMYVNDNMSYQEIADQLCISKPAVLDSIRVAQQKLINLENKLHILAFRQKLSELLTSSSNLKQDIISLLKEV